MRILITGVNGFVGKHLYIDLIKVHEVIGIYNSGNKVFENCFKVDLTNKIEIDDFFKNFGNESIDVVIHLASQMASAINLDDISIINENLKIAKNISSISVKYGIKQL